MRQVAWDDSLGQAYREAIRYLSCAQGAAVGARSRTALLRDTFGAALPDEGEEAQTVLTDLARAVEPGLVRTTSGRFFGFVIGGTMPAALGADWLTSTWDQNAALAHVAPAASYCARRGCLHQ